MMHQNKSKKILFYFFLLFVVGSINNITLSKMKFFQIKNINIKGLADVENEILLSNLNNIFLKNILLINKNEISEVIEKNTLVEPYLPHHKIGIVHFAGKNNDQIRNNKNFISKIETTEGGFVEKKLRFSN